MRIHIYIYISFVCYIYDGTAHKNCLRAYRFGKVIYIYINAVCDFGTIVHDIYLTKIDV